MITNARMAELLAPLVTGAELPPELFDRLRQYLDLLLRWNARVNLTAVRDPEQIVTRHFGESLFAAQILKTHLKTHQPAAATLADVGSGAGFPGIPIKLYLPQIELTLIESQNKKATFLRELVRTLNLPEARVFAGRAEQWEKQAGIVTLRAVEQFERALPIAAELVATQGTLCLLIGASQIPTVQQRIPQWLWAEPVPIPASQARVVLIGKRSAAEAN